MKLQSNMIYEEIISRVAADTHLPARFVDRTYRAYWKAIRQHIIALPLMRDLTDEEFLQLQPNVNIPSLGKLNVTLDRYHGMKKYFEMHYQNYKGKKYKKDNNVKDKEN